MLPRPPLPFVLSIGAANLALQALSILTSILLARALGPEARGELGYALLWAGLFSNMGLLGVHIRLARQAATLSDLASVAALRRRALALLALLSGAVLTIYSVALPWLVAGRSEDTAVLLLVAGLAIPFGMWSATQAQIELARGEAGTYNLTRGAFYVLYLLATTLTVIAGGAGTVPYVWAYTGATGLAILIAHVAVSRRLGAAPTMPLDGSVRKILHESLPFGLSVVVASAVLALDKVVVAYFFSASDLGYYLVASTVITVLAAVGDAVGKWMFARTAGMTGRGDGDHWLAQRFRQVLAFYLVLGLLATLAAPLAVALLYGAAFRPGAWIAVALTPVAVMRELIRALEETTLGLGMPVAQSRAGALYIAVLALGSLLLFTYPRLEVLVLGVWVATSAQLGAIAGELSRRRAIPLGDLLGVRIADLRRLLDDVRTVVGK
jgi:O-antigen/teichoic acid export membrane protein